MAALHDTLGSWLGLIYAATALFRSRDRIQTRLRIALALVFFVSISILHVSTPSVINVRTVNSTVAFSLSATKMPGNMAHISVSDQMKNDLQLTVTSLPYLWERKDSGIGLPPGLNGTCVR